MRRVPLSPANQRRVRELIAKGAIRSSSAWTAIAALVGVRPSDLLEVVEIGNTGEVSVWARTPGDLASRN